MKRARRSRTRAVSYGPKSREETAAPRTEQRGQFLYCLNLSDRSCSVQYVIKAVAQVVLVLAVSTLVAWWRIDIYLVVGVLAMMVTFALFTVREHSARARYGMAIDAIDLIYRVLVSVILGAIWPTLPLIIWAGHARDAAKANVEKPTGNAS